MRLTEQEMTEMANLPFLFFALNLMVGAIMVPDHGHDEVDNDEDNLMVTMVPLWFLMAMTITMTMKLMGTVKIN